ncbi:hypothetical protein I350_05457 [Cryptococcus amylolentus CBS 6273]|uniref:Uncharacterized protein n=1 Tax=Cryptococcus amylolentus CBS 6273 TaxID=1296118 RepID=A0A1E3JXE1_9TREE|nr:hypothetical protein I350_05457 [Cryptococcus amylolentus CBS 6273]
MLTVAIGRASSLGLRDVLRQAAANRKALGKNRFETRPNLQLRRSSKSGGDLLERQDNLPSPFKPLTFDSHALLTTPPLPPVDHIRHPPRDGDFFAGFAPPTESLGEDFRPDGIPRSSSAPSVPLLAMERRKSDASEPSALPGDNSAVSGARPSSYHHNDDSFNNRGGVIFDGSEPREFTSSPRSSSSVQSQHQTIAASRRATVKARNLSDQIHTTPRHHRLHQVIPDASDLSSYLGPELSAALQKRMMESGSSSLSGAGGSGGEARLKGLSDKVSPRLELEVTSGGLGGSSIALGSRGKQKEHVTESEWSFEVPILEVMSQAIKGKMELLEVKEHYHLAEYGCHREIPNPILEESIKALSQQAHSRSQTSFTVVHQATPDFDTRILQANLASHPLSYQKSSSRSAPNVLTTFSFAAFASIALSAASVDFAVCSAGELTKLQGEIPPRPLYSFTSQAEEKEKHSGKDLVRFLEARSIEFRAGGILVLPFVARVGQEVDEHVRKQSFPPRASPCRLPASLPTSPHSSSFARGISTPLTEIRPTMFPHTQQHATTPPVPPSQPGGKSYVPDMFQRMSQALSPAVQRLVSLGEIRTHVAPTLVDVPYWPRTLESVKSVLDKNKDWEILRDAGEEAVEGHDQMNDSDVADMEIGVEMADISLSSSTFPTPREAESGEVIQYSKKEIMAWASEGVKIRRLCHPAWREFKSGRIDRGAYARRIAMYTHSVYEPHLKKVLRDKGRMDISHSENTIEEIFKILIEKCEAGALDSLSIDVGVIVLRRKPRGPLDDSPR